MKRVVTTPRVVVTTLAMLWALVPYAPDAAWSQEEALPSDEITLNGTIRDFQRSHPDFQFRIGTDRGIVTDTIGPDRKPVYAYPPGESSPTTNGVEFFDQWYRDVEGVNLTTDLDITLSKVQDDPVIYRFDDPSFFPIDNQLWGNEGQSHNYWFTFELHAEFTYQGGEVFTFRGDDDVWVYINDKLVIDLGGVHGAQSASVDLDAVAADIGITPGNDYPLDLFFAERHTSASSFRIETSLVLEPSEPSEPPPPSFQPPTADAGPDQTVPEGSVVSLDASGSEAGSGFGLEQSQASTSLPGGTSLEAVLESVVVGSDGLTLEGGAGIGSGPAVASTAIAYVIDVSGSTVRGGGCGGDANNDGRSNDILDCEVAAAVALHEEVGASGTVGSVGVIGFASSANTADMSPEEGIQQLVTPDADVDGDGVMDVEQVLRSAFSRRSGGSVGFSEFSSRTVGNTNTNFASAAVAACNLLANVEAPNRLVVFLSDGANNAGANLNTVLPCDEPTLFETFAAGPSVSCASNPGRGGLQTIADLTGGSCTDVPDLDDLPSILPGVIASELVSAVLTIDDGDPIDISTDLDPELPVSGPANVEMSVALPSGLEGPVHEICLTVNGRDSGGMGSVTTCSELRRGGDELGYRWEMVAAQGPPIFLSSTRSPTPSFAAPDDGVYTFELTVTDGFGSTDSDRVVVTVTNEDPVLTIEPGSAFAGGVTLISASFTDPGWLDTHTGTVDWGDGSVDTFPVTTQGSGWGTFFGSHVYEDAGTYDVTVILTDDDGGEDVASISGFEVHSPVAVWANSETAPKTLNWSGASGSIEGRVHTNNELRFVGQTKSVAGPATYAGSLSADTDRHIFDPEPVEAPVEDFPVRFDVADFRPDGPVSVAVGESYHDMSGSCSAGKWHETQVVLDPGVYYADCDIQINGSHIGGRITLVAEGSIEVSGSRPAFEPFYDGLLFLAGSGGTRTIDISASNSKFLGVLFAGSGGIDVSGSDNRFFCGILGDTVDLSGGDLEVRGANCGRPDSTVSGPLLVPELTLSLEGGPDDVLPSELISYDLRVGNDGATLVVPGLMGVENVDNAAAAITDFDFSIEYFDTAASVWVPLSSAGDANMVFVTSPNAAPGVDYQGDDPAGTAIGAGGLATWGFQAAVSLTPEETELLLDPSRVGGVRNLVEFTSDPSSVQLRRLFTFGSDFIDEARSLSGDITGIDVGFFLPDSERAGFDQATLDALAVLAPGDGVTISEAFTVPVVPPPSDSETDAGYLARLLNLDGSVHTAFAFALANGGVGRLVGPVSVASTTLHLPVVRIRTVGDDRIPAGSTVEYDLPVANLGSVTASAIDMTATAGVDELTVTGPPTTLVAGETGTATTSYTAPADTEGGRVDIRSEVVWSDAAGNGYGPAGSTVDATLLAPAAVVATLVDELVVDANGDGFVSPGDTVRYTLTVTNPGGVPLTGVTATITPDSNSAVIVGSAQTADGTVIGTTPDVVFDFDEIPGGGGAVSGFFDVEVADPFPDGVTRLEVQGTVTADGFEPVLTDDPSQPGAADPTRTTVIVPTPNLVAYLTGELGIDRDGNGFPSPGDLLRYSLRIDSVGSAPLTGVTVTVPIPDQATPVDGSVTTTVGTVTPGEAIEVDIGNLASFDHAEITFELDVAESTTASSIAVQASVTSNELGDQLSDDPSTPVIGDPTVLMLAPSGGGTGPELPGPTVEDFTPADGLVITEPTEVSATLAPPVGESVVSWVVSYRTADSTALVELASGTGTEVSAVVDPTVLPNGAYMIVVTADSSDGGVSMTESAVVVDGRLKPGRYVTTFQDLNVGVGGFPIQVLRTYDSFDKTTGDFGVGWSLEVADFRISTNGPLGAGGWVEESCGGGLVFATLCYTSEKPHFATVVWPDGRTEIFDLTPAEGSTFFPHLTSAEFTGRSNTTSTLVATSSSLFWSNGDLLGGSFGSGGVYDPREFRLTDRFGTEYLLEVGVGLKQMRDRNGNTLTITDTGIASSFGPSVTFTRDTQGRITEVTDPNGGIIAYSYDAAGDLVSVTDQENNTTTFTYLSGHFLDEIIDPLGRPFTTFEYDGDGRMTAVIDGEGNRVEIDSDVGARTETVVDAEQRLTTVSTFDERGNLVTLDEVFDGKSHVTAFTYNALDLETSRTDPLGNTWTSSYDEKGNLLSTVDPLGNETVFVYDEFGLPLSIIDPEGGTTALEYSPTGRLIKWTDGTGLERTYTYDGAGQLETVTGPDGGVTSVDYENGRVSSRTDPLDGVTTYSYDAAGRLTSTTDANGHTTGFAYDSVGKLVSVTDANGNTTSYGYDSLNQLTSISDALGGTVEFGFDDAGRVISVTDANDATREFDYDRNGRVISEIDPLDRPTTFTYDGGGRLASRADSRGEVVTFSYDLAGGLVEDSSTDGVVSYEYDAARRRISMTDPTGTTSFMYDDDGNMTEVDSPNGVVSYSYDNEGRRTSMTTPAGTVSYGYANGRLSSVTNTDGGVTTYGYDLNARLESAVLPNGVSADLQYDPAGHLTSLTYTDLTSAIIDQFIYTYDPAGNRTSAESNAGTETYVFDELNRLLGATSTGSVTSWTYDPAGNRLTETTSGQPAIDYTYDQAGQVTSVDGVTFTHDQAGNLVDDGTFTYTYDAQGRLASTTETATGDTTTIVYDGDGLRSQTTTASGSTPLLWDRATDLPEIISDGTTSYLHAPLQTTSTGAASSIGLEDALGSVRHQSSPAGSVAASLDYTPFGQPASSTLASPFGYTGEWTDPTGHVYLRARVYQPTTGRFLTRDPIQPNHLGTQGWNHYTYTSNNPVTLADPSGLASLFENAIFRSAISGAGIGATLRGAEGLAVCNERARFSSDAYRNCVLGFLLTGAAVGAAFGVAGEVGVFTLGGALGRSFAAAGACLSGAAANLAEDDIFAAATDQERTAQDRVSSIAIGCLLGVGSSGGGTGFGGAPVPHPGSLGPIPAGS